MSLATWKKEFYPVPASRVSKKNALAHSLRKWLGLFKTALKRHGLEKGCSIIQDSVGEGLWIDDTTCALCKYFEDTQAGCPGCPGCPLAKSLGRNCCSNVIGDSPYRAFIWQGNPRPMISALRKAIKEQK